MRPFHAIVIAALVGTVAADVHAQRVEPAGVTPRRDFRDLEYARADSGHKGFSQPSRAAIRVASGAAGFVVGAAAGVGIYSAAGPHHCSGDDGCLGDVLASLILGGIPGAAIGAALPNFGAECSGNARFWRALGGSVAGFAVGFVAVPLGPVLLSPVGAGLALIGC